MPKKNVVDLSARRMGYLTPKDAEGGMAVMGELMKSVCGIDLLRVAVIMKMIEPLLRIEEQTPASFEKKKRLYGKIVSTYDQAMCASLIDTSTESEWKRRPVFFLILLQKATGEILTPREKV